MNNCDRCGKEKPKYLTGSYFNRDMICEDCEKAERAHPKFEEAQEADVKACQAGNFNFPGIGLPPELAHHG